MVDALRGLGLALQGAGRGVQGNQQMQLEEAKRKIAEAAQRRQDALGQVGNFPHDPDTQAQLLERGGQGGITPKAKPVAGGGIEDDPAYIIWKSLPKDFMSGGGALELLDAVRAKGKITPEHTAEIKELRQDLQDLAVEFKAGTVNGVKIDKTAELANAELAVLKILQKMDVDVKPLIEAQFSELMEDLGSNANFVQRNIAARKAATMSALLVGR